MDGRLEGWVIATLSHIEKNDAKHQTTGLLRLCHAFGAELCKAHTTFSEAAVLLLKWLHEPHLQPAVPIALCGLAQPSL